MRYCIGCKHWSCSAHEPGHVYSEYTSDCDTPAQLACKKGHWQRELDNLASDDANTEAIYAAMCLAETCPEFDEREIPAPTVTGDA